MSQSEQTREPQPDVIEILQGLLMDAELGALQGVGIVGVGADGKIGHCYRGSAGDDRLRLLGGLELLKARIIRDCEEHKDDDTE